MMSSVGKSSEESREIQMNNRRVKAEVTKEYIEPHGLNSTFSNDFNVLFFGDAFVNDLNSEDTGSIGETAQEGLGVVNQDVDQEPVTSEQQNIAYGDDVTDPDLDPEQLVIEGDVTAGNEEAAVIKGVDFDMDASSFICTGGALATHGDEYNVSKQIEQVIEYEYDLIVEAGSDVGLALEDFERSLLSYLESELELSGCVVGRLLVEKISSLPKDNLNENAICDGHTLSEVTNSECHPINGYISAYYSGDLSIGNDVAESKSIRGLIMNGMSSNAIVTKSTLQTRYISSRSSSTQEVNMLLSKSSTETKSIASTIGMFGAGLAAIIILGLAAFMVKRKYNNGKTKAVNKVERMPADVENAVHPDDLDRVDNDSPEIDMQGSFYYDHSISSASTQMVSNRRPKPVENPLYLEQPIVEETLSEDEADDALPSFHNECYCLGE